MTSTEQLYTCLQQKDTPLSQYKAIKDESMKLKPVTPLDGLTLSDKLARVSAQAGSANKAVCEQGISAPDWHFVNTVLAFHLTPETEGLLCCFMVVNGLFTHSDSILYYLCLSVCFTNLINCFGALVILKTEYFPHIYSMLILIKFDVTPEAHSFTFILMVLPLTCTDTKTNKPWELI